MRRAVVVPERGEVKTDDSTWRSLQREATFWDLVDAGVVEARQLRGGGARIFGSRYVGRALCGDIEVECREKIPGALLAMLKAGLSEFQILTPPAPETELGDTVAAIVRAFLGEVRRYVGAGRRWEYRSQRRVSSLIGGKIHMPSTVGLRARGLRHLVAFDKPLITYAIDVNRVVAAALWETETLGRIVALSESDLSTARQLSLFFEDCHDPAANRLLLDGSTISEILDDPRHSDIRTMFSLAGVILSHSAFEPTAPLPGATPISWFLNLETLFERTVRSCLADVLGAMGTVAKGSEHERRVFPNTGGLRADPDLVVNIDGEVVIGDVKYKAWSRSASPSDLYQLLVHAKAFDAGAAFLVYPSDSFDEVDLGPALTGTRVWLFAVDVREISEGLEVVLQRITDEEEQ